MLPNVLVYIGLVFRTAWGHSASLARNIIFYAIVIIGAAAFLVPTLGMTIDTAGLLSLLSNPKFGFGLFGAIVISRILCAPYWIWKDDQKTIAALREDHTAERQRRNRNIAKLQDFYASCALLSNAPTRRIFQRMISTNILMKHKHGLLIAQIGSTKIWARQLRRDFWTEQIC